MNATNTTGAEQEVESRPREQRLVLYHPTSTGNGAALQLEPRLNRRESDRYNCFFLELATQKTTAGKDGDRKVPATFDWEHKLTVKLDFPDICELLTVLEGRADKAGGQRNGLYHENGRSNTMISFQRGEKGGYCLGLSRKDKASGQIARVQIVLSEPEATGLRSIFQIGLFFITFHAHLVAGPGRSGLPTAEPQNH